MKELFKWGIISVIALGIISTVLDNGEVVNIQTVNKDIKQEEVSAQAYKIGDEMQIGNLTYEVEGTDVRNTVGDKYINKKAKGQYLVVKVSVTNNDKDDRVVDNSIFQLVDKDGIIYEPDTEVDTYVNDDSMFFYDKISPNITKTGYIAFDIADPNTEYDLIVTGGMLSNDEAIINLN
jgi:Domain of unknown function (DUF4352)